MGEPSLYTQKYRETSSPKIEEKDKIMDDGDRVLVTTYRPDGDVDREVSATIYAQRGELLVLETDDGPAFTALRADVRPAVLCKHCGQTIEPDPVNDYIHAEDGVVGCGLGVDGRDYGEDGGEHVAEPASARLTVYLRSHSLGYIPPVGALRSRLI
jgi:hypothetical protein